MSYFIRTGAGGYLNGIPRAGSPLDTTNAHRLQTDAFHRTVLAGVMSSTIVQLVCLISGAPLSPARLALLARHQANQLSMFFFL